MNELAQRALSHPFSFLLVCGGIALVLRAAGTHKIVPNLLHFGEVVLKRLWEEFTKRSSERSAIEAIDFVLVVFFAAATLLAILCLFLPSGIAQAVGIGANVQASAVGCVQYSLTLLLVTGITSGILVVISDKDSAIRMLLQCLAKQSPSPSETESGEPLL